MKEPLKVQTASINGTELSFVEEGNGIAAVFVHGTLGDYRTWRRQLTPFAKHFHALSYSRRGHYPASWTGQRGEYSVELHADDLVHLLRRITDEPAHIVTASWGGNVALQLAISHPELVQTIVLAEPPTLPLLAKDSKYRHLLEEFNAHSLQPARASLLNGQWKEGVRFFIDGVMGNGAFNSMPAAAHRYFLDNASELQAETVSRNYIPDFTPDMIALIACPVLMLEGDRSPKLFHAIIDILESCFPNATRVRIPNASHGIHTDNAPAYNARVLDFLLKHP